MQLCCDGQQVMQHARLMCRPLAPAGFTACTYAGAEHLPMDSQNRWMRGRPSTSGLTHKQSLRSTNRVSDPHILSHLAAFANAVADKNPQTLRSMSSLPIPKGFQLLHSQAALSQRPGRRLASAAVLGTLESCLLCVHIQIQTSFVTCDVMSVAAAVAGTGHV